MDFFNTLGAILIISLLVIWFIAAHLTVGIINEIIKGYKNDIK
jgi:hypothetical protein